MPSAPMASLNSGYGVYLQTDIGGPSLIGGVTKQRLTADSKAGHQVSAGSYYPMIATVDEQMPKGEFTTRDIDAFLALCLPPVAALSGVGCSLYQLKKVDGTVGTGSVHRKWAIAKGVIVPQRLSIQQGQSAEISAQVYSRSATSAGEAPIAPTEASALLGTLADSVRYSMGAVTLGSGAIGIDGKTSFEIDFGVKAEQVCVDGNVWPSWVDVAEYLAKITIKSVNTAIVAAAGIPLTGIVATHANGSFYLRRRLGAGFDPGSTHIKGTFDGLCYVEDVFDATGNEKGECSLVVICRYDGTNPPIDFSLAQALA